MTISPPAKVKTLPLDEYPVLASGVDSLYLAIDVNWTDDAFFASLEQLKLQAKEDKDQVPGSLRINDTDCWKFNMRPFGTNGYDWLLEGHEFTLKIGNWKTPQSRPSVLAEIRSETLWCLGPETAVNRIVDLLLAQGGTCIMVKPSRIDLCLDILLPAVLWTQDLVKFQVCRASKSGHYFDRDRLTGITVGRGDMSARLYDKPLEIKTQSGKDWMYDIWQIHDVPNDRRIIRVEFQLRREILVQLGVKRFDEVNRHRENVWAYCTQKWLKYQTGKDEGKHHTQRKTLPWWQSVQVGFSGFQAAKPLIRGKAFAGEMKQYHAMAMGAMTSLAAVHKEYTGAEETQDLNLSDCLAALFDAAECAKKQGMDFGQIVAKKRAQHARLDSKFKEVLLKRKEAGFPDGF